MTATPELTWPIDGTMRVIETAMMAATDLDAESGRRRVMNAVSDFAAEADRRGENDSVYFGLALALAKAALIGSTPDDFGEGDGPTIAVMVDSITGEQIDDPDAEADDVGSSAALLCTRLIAAVADGDTDRAFDFFQAAHDDAVIYSFVLLAEWAARSVLNDSEARGTIPPDVAQRLAERRALEPAAPESPTRRTASTGTEYVTLPATEHDRGPDALATAAPHGPGQYCVAIYVPGVEGHREAVVSTVHHEIVGTDPSVSLCGVHHVEDVESWQIPHAGRRMANRQIRKLERQFGRPVQLLRGWQHAGPCPEVER